MCKLDGPISLSRIVLDIAERHKEELFKPSLIADEFDGSKLTLSEAEVIKRNLNKFTKLLIIPHSMDTKRVRCTVDEEKPYGGYEYIKTGMKIKRLNRIMRNPLNIIELARVTTEALRKHKNIFHDPEQEKQQIKRDYPMSDMNEDNNRRKEGTIADFFTSLKKKINRKIHGKFPKGMPSQKNPDFTTDIPEIEREQETELESKNKESIDTDSTDRTGKGNQLMPESTQVPERNQKPLSIDTFYADETGQENKHELESKNTQHIPLHFDHAIKQASNYKCQGEKRIVSTFNFHGKYEPGHSIKSRLPIITHLIGLGNVLSYKNVNDWDIRCRMKYLLRNMVKIHGGDEGLCIICFDTIDALLYEATAKAMDIPVILYTPVLGIPRSEKSVAEYHDQLATHILITDHVGCRGLEFRKIVVSIDPEEKYLHQFLLESITRCLGDLYITLIRKNITKDVESMLTCADIIQKWEEKRLVEKHDINICTKEECEDSFEESCSDVDTIHNIHQNCGYFDDIQDNANITEIVVDKEGSLANYKLFTEPNMLNENWMKQKHLREFSMKEMSYIEDRLNKSDQDSIRILIDMKKEKMLNLKSNTGDSMLHIAAKYDAIESLELMLESGLWIEERNNDGHTPLMVAVINQAKKSAKYLLEQEANIYARDNENNDVMGLAEKTEDATMIDLLRDGIKKNKDSIPNERLIFSGSNAVDSANSKGDEQYLSAKFVNTFVGRSRELKDIHDVMMSNEKEGVVLHGMAGVGKSELARQYSKRYASKFTKIYLINGENKSTIRNKLQDILFCLLPETDVNQLDKLKSEKIMKKVFKALANDDSLLIFDNLTCPKKFCSWLEVTKTISGKTPKLIVTSQKSDFDITQFHLLPVQPLQKHDAIEFLKVILQGSKFDKTAADKTCQILGYHPLGIKLATAFVFQKGIDLKKFNNLVSADQDFLLYSLFPPNYGKPLYSTINLSVSDVFQSTDRATTDLLCLSSIMDTQDLEVKLLLEYTGDNDKITSSLQELTNRSLLRKKDDDCYEMQSLIKTVVKIKIRYENVQSKYVKTLLQMISSYQKKHLNRNHTSYSDTWLHHVLPILNNHSEDIEIMKLMEDVKADIIDAFMNKGDYRNLMKYLRLFLQGEIKRDEHFDMVWKTKYEIGRCLYKSGDYLAGINHFGELLAQCKQKYGDEYHKTLATTNDLALCMEVCGDLSSARSLYQTVYDVELRLYGDEDNSTLASMSNLAACMRAQGDLEGAIQLYEKVFDVRKRTLGVDHPDTLRCTNNLAACMEKQGDMERARSLYEQAYEAKKRVFGEHNPSTLVTLMNLGLCMNKQGEIEEARQLLKKAYNDLKGILGSSHPKTIMAKHNLDACISS